MARKKKKKGGSGDKDTALNSRLGRGIIVAIAVVAMAVPVTIVAAMGILRWNFTIESLIKAFYFAMMAVPVHAVLSCLWVSMLRAKPVDHPWVEALLFTVVAAPFTALAMLYLHEGWSLKQLEDLVVSAPDSLKAIPWTFLGFLLPSVLGMRAGLGAVDKV